MKKNESAVSQVPLICDVDLKKYLGTWYEIAKLSARDQRGLEDVTAVYTLRKNGKIKVHNMGYKRGKKKGIKGSAWLRDESCTGGLYVRFFWPLKSQYNVIKLASDYRYAVVMGEEKSSLWILSRWPKMKERDYNEIMSFLEDQDFKVDQIIKTKQDRNE